MNYIKLSFAAYMVFSFRAVSAQIDGGENFTATIVGGTPSARVPGYVASGPGSCGGQLIHPDIVVRTGLMFDYIHVQQSVQSICSSYVCAFDQIK